MELKQACEAFEYHVSGGSEYCWHCYGPNARYLDFENEHASGSIIFDSKKQTVYVAEVTSSEGDHAYRWMNSEFIKQFEQECLERNVDSREAWQGKNWVDLEVEDDFVAKAKAIFKGVEFDRRVDVPIDISDEELFLLMKMAHERDITLNKMVEIILQEAIDKANVTND